MNQRERDARFWQAKVAAWVHDPAEKALVLLRDPQGHEGGTSKKLREELFPQGLDESLKKLVKEADHWAAAADRPQFPRSAHDGRYASWSQVDFVSEPQLIHPLSGDSVSLQDFEDIDKEHIKAVSFDHLSDLIHNENGAIDYRRTMLALWRFGSESPARGIGALWSMLPADTRTPDHSIWEHLRLCSAYAGATCDGQASLLLLSLGPVQGFIAQARSTSDLWAGSHLLSRLSWEAMRVVAEWCGPDAILFPNLHGVPIVDLWLVEQGLDFSRSKGIFPDWMRFASDANPLFIAALPNRFLALVPESIAEDLAREVRTRVRDKAKSLACEAWRCVATLAELDEGDGLSQIADQLHGFPEVHWAVIPASLAKSSSDLQKAMEPFFPADDTPPGFLGSSLFRALSKDTTLEGTVFFPPGPGTLYPALYDLTERTHAAAKTSQTFSALNQEGYRCSLCGEREWLTTDRKLLAYHTQDNQPGSPWPIVAQNPRAWAKPGERLCALCCTKRLWPTLFSEELKTILEKTPETVDIPLKSTVISGQIQRYVVSTHTMALASTFREMARGFIKNNNKLKELAGHLEEYRHTALPRQLAHASVSDDLVKLFHRFPAALDDARGDDDGKVEKLRSLFKQASGHVPETYYGLILLDGDRMGAWLAGEAEGVPSLQQCFHSKIRSGVQERIKKQPALDTILSSRRSPSPSYHSAISRALNGFSLHIARAVVEDSFLGKLIYAGGDDLLAMVAVQDLLPVLLSLRCAYAGIGLGDEIKTQSIGKVGGALGERFLLRRGYVLEKKRQLFQTMGVKATLSAGAVVAHHTTPLGMMLSEARKAEHAAKSWGRDAFCLSLMKRSGGITEAVYGWDIEEKEGIAVNIHTTPMALLLRTSDAIRDWLSRRAAYHVQDWLDGLPPTPTGDRNSYESMLTASIQRVFRRQGEASWREDTSVKNALADLAGDLVRLALDYHDKGKIRSAKGVIGFIQDLMVAAEFLAREQRGGQRKAGNP